MKRQSIGLVLALVAAVSFTGWAVQFPIVVTGISVEGNTEIKDRELLDVVSFEIGAEIGEVDLRASSQAIFDLGWFSEVSPNVTDDGNVSFRVVENPVVREIVISGNINRKTYSLFGVDLFSLRIMPSYMVRQILWRNDVRKRSVLNRNSLETALEELLEDYNDDGYILITLGDVKIDETLSIEIIEPLVSGSTVSGLNTVPVAIAEEMIDLPLGEPLQKRDLQRVYASLSGSIFFSGVEVVPQPTTAADQVSLAWTIEERMLIPEAVQLDAIVVEGVASFVDEDIAKLVKQPTGGVLDNYELLLLLEDVYDAYIDEGYIMARFAVLGVEEGVLHVVVEEGLISEITLSGNTHTRDYVVMRNLDVATGRVLDRSDLVVTYQRLASLGYFESIDIIPEWTDEGVSVSISVTEKTRLGGFNGTMAMDPSTGGLVGELSLNQKNLGGTGQDISVSYSRGIAAVEDEPEVTTWDLGYSTVAYFPEFDRVGLDLYRSAKEIPLEEETINALVLGAEVSFEYPLRDYVDVGLSFKHEEERINGSTEWTPTDSVTLGLVYDSTDELLFPTSGARRRVSLEKAGGFAAGTEYAKAGLSWARFVPVENSMFGDRDQTMAIRFDVGVGDSLLPETQFYALGGASSVRGTDELSVRRHFVCNAEYRVELIDGLYMASFFDAGVNLDSVRLDGFLASTGIEFGVAAAGMFVRLDLVWRLDSDRNWFPQFDIGFGPMF
ncbi:BamA/TamA family outer membrane protein [Candidatus Bipolaricaulota bacterium]|nr:BamA/TamA family outer membrane protein [Candidatus Bipolaricaulota bacterium]